MCTRISMLLIALLGGVCVAHDSPEHVVEALTQRIQSEGRTPELLLRRAYEYQALAKYAEAESDLRDAIALDAEYAEAYARLAHVFNAQGKYENAAQALADGLKHATSEVDTVELLAIRATLHESNGAYAQALADCETVLSHRPKELEPLLHKSHILAQMGETDARVHWLRNAKERNPSIVLEIELTDALIEARAYDEALARVIEAANGKRYLSAWRIRRAQIHLGLGEKAQAENELRLALEEIDQRAAGPAIDPILLLQRATAHALLNQPHPASQALQAAQKSGASPRETRQVQRLLPIQ